MADVPSTSSSLHENNDESEFKYIQDFDFLFKQLPSSSTCEIVNVKPLDQSIFQNSGSDSREMRSRQHLHYQLMRTFNDSNEFDQWWNHEGNSAGWIFNTIYKKKTEDEVHVYRCGHRNCSQRLRVLFLANCCDVRVEKALVGPRVPESDESIHHFFLSHKNYKEKVEHTHGEKFVKIDSIKTLSEDAKAKISALEALGITATKIRRSLFKESTNGINVPTLKQIQNYIARIRTKRTTPCTLITSSTEIKQIVNNVSVDLGNKRKRGRPRRLERSEVLGEAVKVEVAEKVEFIKKEIERESEREAEKEVEEVDDKSNSTEIDAFQKLSQLLQTCQQKIKQNGEPFAKRQRQTYHFEKSFPTKEEFEVWWEAKKPEGLVHNSTYANNAGEKIDIYRCAKRDCQHRVRLVFNPVDKSVCVERSDADHDASIHESRTSFTRESKSKINELFDLGLKPKAIRIHLMQNGEDPSQIPTLTQIKNLVNRLKIKKKSSSSNPNTSQFSFLDDVGQRSYNLFATNHSNQL